MESSNCRFCESYEVNKSKETPKRGVRPSKRNYTEIKGLVIGPYYGPNKIRVGEILIKIKVLVPKFYKINIFVSKFKIL